MMIFYGHKVKKDGDHLITMNDKAIISSTRAGSPTAYAVNTFPVCAYARYSITDPASY
jgi:hypothetical protein